MSTSLSELTDFPQEWVAPLAAYNLTTLRDFLSYCRMENGHRNLAGVLGVEPDAVEAVERAVSAGVSYSAPPPVKHPMGGLVPGDQAPVEVVPMHEVSSDEGSEDG